MTTDLIQRSPEWFAERLGSLGASEVYDAVARQKTGKFYATREAVMAKKLLERVTGNLPTQINAPAVRHGIDNEDAARARYEIEQMVTVKEVGLFKHNRIAWTHASPDGVRADSNVGIEIKCLKSENHLRALLDGEFEPKYITQCHWQIAVCGFERVDLVAYDPRFPERAQMAVKPIWRDEKIISELEEQVEEFLSELAKREAEFRENFMVDTA